MKPPPTGRSSDGKARRRKGKGAWAAIWLAVGGLASAASSPEDSIAQLQSTLRTVLLDAGAAHDDLLGAGFELATPAPSSRNGQLTADLSWSVLPLAGAPGGLAEWQRQVEWLGAVEDFELMVVAGRDAAAGAVQLTGRLSAWGTSGATRRWAQWRGDFLLKDGVFAGLRSATLYRLSSSGQRFHDVTGELLADCAAAREQLSVGLDTYLRRMDRLTGIDRSGTGTLIVHDVDGDGRQDLYVTQPASLPNRLLRQREDGGFEDASHRSGLDVLDATTAACFVELNGDGLLDAVLVGTQVHVLRGTGQEPWFEPAVDAVSMTGLTGSAVYTGLAAGDVDQDGDQDLYVTAHRHAPAERIGAPFPFVDASNGPANLLLCNDSGDELRLTDRAQEAGLAGGNRRCSTAAVLYDFDGDGRLDLHVANEFAADQRYLGQGDGRFLPTPAGVVGRTRWLAVDAGVLGPKALWRGGGADLAIRRQLAAMPLWAGVSRRNRADLLHHLAGGTDGLWWGESAGGALGDWLDLGRPQVLVLAGLQAGEDGSADLADSLWTTAAPTVSREGLSEAEVEAALAAWDIRLQRGAAWADSQPDRLLLDVEGEGTFDAAPLVGLRQLGNGRAAAALDLGQGGVPELAVLSRDRGLQIWRRQPSPAADPHDSAEDHDADHDHGHADEWRGALLSAHVPGLLLPDLMDVEGQPVQLGPQALRRLRVHFAPAPPTPAELAAWRAAPAAQDFALVWLAVAEKPRLAEAALVLLDYLLARHAPLESGTVLQLSSDGRVEGVAQGLAPAELFLAQAHGHYDGRWLARRPRAPLVELTRRYREAGMPEQALHALAVGAGDEEDAIAVTLERGLALAAEGRAAAAVAQLAQCPDDHSRWVEISSELGRQQRRLGRLEEADEVLSRALALEPLHPVARPERGLVRWQQQRVGEAAEDLRLAAYLQPDSFAVQLAFGDVLQREGRREESHTAYQRAAELMPARSEPWLRRGLMDLQVGEFERGERLLRTAMERAPEKARAYFELANFKLHQQDLDAAEELARQALERDPRQAAIGELLGQIEQARQQP